MDKLRVLDESIITEVGIATQIVKSFPIVQKNRPVFVHSHEFYEITYIVSGGILHTHNFNENFAVTGDCFIVKPNEVHFFRKSQGCEHRDILISKSLFNGVAKIIPDLENAINSKQKLVLSLEDIHRLESGLNEFSKTQNLDEKKIIGVQVVLDIFRLLFKSSKTDSNTDTPSLLNKILDLFTQSDYIKKGIPLVAKTLQYDPSYLGRFFKKCMGITMSNYLTNIRLNYAVYYLSTTTLSLGEICDEIGIESTSYFNKIFKNKFNIPPIKYRKIYKNDSVHI
ncbi:MAG: helix-turn-helix domain-containing protein [Clostridiales bacterium]|nr:helix-turn-helix domain-containing protein [Clostridiales bacterium]